jgi:PAS domain S-box-containing protein
VLGEHEVAGSNPVIPTSIYHSVTIEIHGRSALDATHGLAHAHTALASPREAVLLKAGALQRAIFNSANFSSIATDAKGVIQIFNVGAERMLGYTAAEVMNKITPADISDPQEVIARAKALSASSGRRSRRASRRWCSRPRAGSRTSTS